MMEEIETTGLPSHENNKTRITEISFVAVKRSHISLAKNSAPRVQNKITLCLNPRKMIDPESTKATGLCNDLLEYEPAFNLEVFTILDSFLGILTKPVCLVAQNGLFFDYPILKKQLNDLKVTFPDDLLCADSLHAFYDIIQARERAAKSTLDEIAKCSRNTTQEEYLPEICNDVSLLNETKCTSTDQLDDVFTKLEPSDMQRRNETTPRQQIIKNIITPCKEKSVCHRPSKAHRKFPWSAGAKPKESFKLKDIYERLLGRPALNTHRAEADCILMMECAGAVSLEFTEWIDRNYVSFTDIKPMTIGVPLGS